MSNELTERERGRERERERERKEQVVLESEGRL